MVQLSTIQKDMGLYIRDLIRADSTILAFNSAVTAQNWIFFGRPKDLNDPEFNVPRIIVEPIDEVRNNFNLPKQKQVLIPYLIHAWLDQENSDPFDSYDLGDDLKNLYASIESGTTGVEEAQVIGFSNTPEPHSKKTLNHVVVRMNVTWNEVLI